MHALQRAQSGQTIAAQSTARGLGAIAIVRLTGPEALGISAALGCGPLADKSHKLQRVLLQDSSGAGLDDAMAVAMPKPNSYTGEDLVELHVHGGEAVVAAVLQACFDAGARPAEPGEFTLRAFVNGRLDLAQAEAVGALIHAQTQGGRQRALAALQGSVSRVLHEWLGRLEGVAASWLAQLDFPDDTSDGAQVTQEQGALCAAAKAALSQLLDRMVLDDEQPPQVVLMGAVNTGKSTLTNVFCGGERALVDAEAGTTRDAIEVPLRWGGQRLQLWDTAGLRAEARGLEARGISLGSRQAQKAQVVVWLCGHDNTLWPPDELLHRGAHVLLLGAQADRLDGTQRARLQAAAKDRGLVLQGFVSGRTQEGVNALQQLVCQALAGPQHPAEGGEPALGNVRHAEQLRRALGALGDVQQSLRQAMPLDLMLSDLQIAVRALGHIVGRDVDAHIIDRIFKDFCIGK